MRAAPILEIAGAFERQLVLQISLDELVVFDEPAIEARRRGLRISLRNSASVHTQAFLGMPIMTRPTRGICEMIGNWSDVAARPSPGQEDRHDFMLSADIIA